MVNVGQFISPMDPIGFSGDYGDFKQDLLFESINQGFHVAWGRISSKQMRGKTGRVGEWEIYFMQSSLQFTLRSK